MGIRATAQRRDFQVSKKGGYLVQVDKVGKETGVSKKGVAKGDVSMRLNIYIVLTKDCV
jgi:hypothetical protein